MNRVFSTTPGAYDQRREDLSTAVATAYDMQKLRISVGNRLCANFRGKLGLAPSQSEEELEEQMKNILKQIRASYELMAEGVRSVTKADGSLDMPRTSSFKPTGCITTFGEFMMFKQYLALEAQEDDHFQKGIPSILRGIPIYDYYLDHVKGVGPAMAAIIIRYLDIHKAASPGAFWAYAGLDVVRVVDEKTHEERYEGRRKLKAHLVEKVYKDRKGEETRTLGVSYHPFLKTKLMGVLAGSFLKCKSPYSKLYYDYKLRLENHARHASKTKAHKHAMALRYMIKQFLLDLHFNWRLLEGLPPSIPYHEAVLGHVHHTGATYQPLTTLVFPEDERKAA